MIGDWCGRGVIDVGDADGGGCWGYVLLVKRSCWWVEETDGEGMRWCRWGFDDGAAQEKKEENLYILVIECIRSYFACQCLIALFCIIIYNYNY